LTNSLRGGATVLATIMLAGTAMAADLSATPVPPPLPPGPIFTGPLAGFAAPLAEKGITFHATILDFFGDNPSIGLQRGRGSNDAYIIEGVDFDLSKLFGLPGTSIHYENIFFAGVLNLNAAPQIGDSQIGYPPPYTPELARLSRATIEQKAFDGRLDIEAGITHPGYYFAKFQCGTYNACFQDVLYIDAGYTSYGFAVPGGNVSFNITPSVYIEAGAFANQPNANKFSGYDFYREKYNGVLTMGEIGSKTSFATDPYPYKVSLTGYYNTAIHTVDAPGPAATKTGTSGIVFQAEKVVWRPDGGYAKDNPTPTNVKIYGSFGQSLDSSVAIESDAWIGATLSAPFQARPADYYGVKFYWERVTTGFDALLNTALPPTTTRYQRDSYTFEASAHLALPYGAAFEPVFDYTIHPNDYWVPASPKKVNQGIYIGGTVAIPLGQILGLSAKS
jgi:porin